jgi:hypothetical protein
VPDERDNVDADAVVREDVEVLAHGLPGDVEAPGGEVLALLLGDGGGFRWGAGTVDEGGVRDGEVVGAGCLIERLVIRASVRLEFLL